MSEGACDSDISQELLQVLEAPGNAGQGLLVRLAELREKRGQPACSILLETLTGVRLHEPAAERSLTAIERHREELARFLGRDPGFPVAAFDYFINVEPRLRSPRMVEIQKYREMERLAVTDALTGLPNRRRFRLSAGAELRRADRYGLPTSLLFLDLDDFKETNDRWGHREGDVVLREVADLLRLAVREVDLPARYGGEEFAVLLPETSKEGAVSVGERIRGSVEERFAGREGKPAFGMTISGGVASFPEDGDALDGLLRRADEALYSAKSRGKNLILTPRPERRRFSRFLLADLPLQSTVVLSGGPEASSVESPAQAKNLSRSGALVEADRPVQVGAAVRVRFQGTDPSRPGIVMSGRVVRGERLETGAGARFDLGIDFLSASPREQEELGRLLASRARATEEG